MTSSLSIKTYCAADDGAQFADQMLMSHGQERSGEREVGVNLPAKLVGMTLTPIDEVYISGKLIRHKSRGRGSLTQENAEKLETTKVSRRNVLKAAIAAGGAAVLGFPNIVKSQGVPSMRWQSTWPSKDIFHEFALDFAKKVNDMTGGELKIEVLPAGAVVPAFGLLDAVSKGTLDGGHGVLAYHYGKQNALALWGSGPGYGMDANMLLSWHKYGGGRELLNKLYASIGANVVSFPYGPMPTQPLGWFKKPITKADDLKGLKFRTVGISIDLFYGHGRGGERFAGRRNRPGDGPWFTRRR